MKLLRFHANWCAPCHRMKPIIEEVAAEHNLTIEDIDVDTDAGTYMGIAWKIGSVPTVILLDGNTEKARITGAMPKTKVEEALFN